MTLLSNHFYPGFFLANYCVIVRLQILVDAVAGYGLLPSESFYFLLWASRRLYCHNNNKEIRSFILPFHILFGGEPPFKSGREQKHTSDIISKYRDINSKQQINK